MKLDTEYYPPKYKTAEGRALYLVAKKTKGNFIELARSMGFMSTYFSTVLKKGLPIKYAGYLGRKYNFNPAILAHESYLLMTRDPKSPTRYEDIVILGGCDFFSPEDQQYILAGTYIKDPVRFLRIHDKEVIK